jgi:beta-lactamase regulating signal transducer with metallopeptidase domain
MNDLLAWLWQGLVIAGLTSAAVRIVPPGAAAKRHFLWSVALVLTLVLPFVDRIAWPQAGGVIVGAVTTGEHQGFTVPMPPAWLVGAALALWALAVIIHLVRLGFGIRALRSLVAAATPLDADRAARLTARAAGRRADLRVSTGIAGACAVGFLRPVVLISSQLVASLDDEALEAVILHEYAHLERYDDWARAAECVVRGVALWHPAVLWICRHIDVEREIACDQRVVTKTQNPLAYARSLARAAALIADGRGMTSMVAPAFSTTAMLRLRVERLLRLAPARHHWMAASLTISACASVIATALWILRMPVLVSFASVVAPPAILASSSFASASPHELPGAMSEPPATASSAAGNVTPAEGASVAGTTPVPQATAAPVPAGPSATQDVTPIDAAPSTVNVAALNATPIAFAARIPRIESASASVSERGEGVDWAALGWPPAAAGIAFARAGTATGTAASRAGTSVGRFLKNGGLALARSF